MSNTKLFSGLKSTVLVSIVFLFPLFFLPLTQEFFATNKFYLLGFGALLLVLISTVEFLITKKMAWEQKPLDRLVFLFVLTAAASTVIVSPNKVQSILNVNFGLGMLASLAILYYYLSRNLRLSVYFKVFSVSSVLLSLVTVIFYFQPFAKSSLPVSLQFLKNSLFSPMGGQIDLLLILGFFAVVQIGRILVKKHTDYKDKAFLVGSACLTLVALGLTLYSTFTSSVSQASNILPPVGLSWYAAVDILKSPLNAVFGVGVDNFTSIYTKVKDVAYNQTLLWQIPSFSVSRSAILHVLTETGLLGFATLVLLLTAISRPLFANFKKQPTNPLFLMVVYVLLALFLFPPSLSLFYLLFILLGVIANEAKPVSDQTAAVSAAPMHVSLANLIPLYLGIIVIAFSIVGFAGYYLGTTYLAEYKFKQSLVGYTNNNAKELYDNQVDAIVLNPYLERYRINFSQTNLLIANNIVRQAIESQQGKDKIELSANDQQTVSQAIQSAISEGKAAVSLNPQKATNWENLAVIYRSVINAVSGPVDTWAAAAYQRAISLDPQNPQYRLNLGGIYYSVKAFDEANKLFEQAAALKSDWPNAYYNWAWSSYQKADYQTAAQAMQNVVNLLDPKKDKVDYDKASADLVEFKKKLPSETAEATSAAEQNPPQLSLPEPTKQPVKPPVVLPTGAEPEAEKQ